MSDFEWWLTTVVVAIVAAPLMLAVGFVVLLCHWFVCDAIRRMKLRHYEIELGEKIEKIQPGLVSHLDGDDPAKTAEIQRW